MKFAVAIAVLQVVFFLVTLGWFGWAGNWGGIGLVLILLVVSRILLGLAEFVLTPLALVTIAFARRGWAIASGASASIHSILQGFAFAAFCCGVLVLILREEGPPGWMLVILGANVAVAPFAWTIAQAEQQGRESFTESLTAFGALLSCVLAGALLLNNVERLYAVAPVFLVFALLACVKVWWFFASGRYLTMAHEGLLERAERDIAKRHFESLRTTESDDR